MDNSNVTGGQLEEPRQSADQDEPGETQSPADGSRTDTDHAPLSENSSVEAVHKEAAESDPHEPPVEHEPAETKEAAVPNADSISIEHPQTEYIESLPPPAHDNEKGQIETIEEDKTEKPLENQSAPAATENPPHSDENVPENEVPPPTNAEQREDHRTPVSQSINSEEPTTVAVGDFSLIESSVATDAATESHAPVDPAILEENNTTQLEQPETATVVEQPTEPDETIHLGHDAVVTEPEPLLEIAVLAAPAVENTPISTSQPAQDESIPANLPRPEEILQLPATQFNETEQAPLLVEHATAEVEMPEPELPSNPPDVDHPQSMPEQVPTAPVAILQVTPVQSEIKEQPTVELGLAKLKPNPIPSANHKTVITPTVSKPIEVQPAPNAKTPVSAKSLILGKKKKLFISFPAGQRSDDVKKMAQFLKTQGFDVWIDGDGKFANSKQKLTEEINSADVVVVFFNQAYAKKGSNGLFELKTAKDKKKPIQLVRLQNNYKPDSQFLALVPGLSWVDYNTAKELNTVGKDLADKIRSLLAEGDKLVEIPTPIKPAAKQTVSTPDRIRRKSVVDLDGLTATVKKEGTAATEIELFYEEDTAPNSAREPELQEANKIDGKLKLLREPTSLAPVPEMVVKTEPKPEIFSMIPQGPSFEPVNVPSLLGGYLNRPEDEKRIRNAIVNTCNDPSKGILVIAGDPGVGKTTLVSRLFAMKSIASTTPGGEELVALNHSTAVFWLNCFQWRDHFDEDDKKDFGSEIVNAAKLYDKDCDGTSPAGIIPYFVKRGKQVLFVLDDLFSASLLSYFVGLQTSSSQLSCCVIARNSVPLSHGNLSRIIRPRSEKLEPLTLPAIQDMLENIFSLKGRLSSEQMAELAKMCYGLPLIATLIYGRIRIGDGSTNDWGKFLQVSSVNVTDIFNEIKTAVEGLKGESDTILRLLELIMDSLCDMTLCHCYYAFLFFEPNVLISEKDLRMFWGSTADVIGKMIEASLAQVPEMATGKGVQNLLIHQMLHEAALKKASEEFQLQGSEVVRLQTVREKLLSGELKSDSPPEMVMFEAVRQQRLDLCRRFVKILDAKMLSRLCLKQSKNDGCLFIHFLYRTSWPEFDVEYDDSHSLVEHGVNSSYRLIIAILLKLKVENLLVEKFQAVSSDTTSSVGQNFGKFIVEVFDDEHKKSQWHERQPIIKLLKQWRAFYQEEKLRAQILAKEHETPMLAAIVRGDEAKFQSSYKQWKVGKSESGKTGDQNVDPDYVNEAMLYTARYGRLQMLEFLCKNEKGIEAWVNAKGEGAMLFAARYGHLDIVKFLASKDSKLVSQVDNDGRTAMINACKNGHLNVVKFLSDKNSKLVSLGDTDGLKPLMYASENGHLDVVRFLLEKDRTSISQTDNEGWTPMMSACSNGHLEVVKLLAVKDAKLVSKVDNEGGTAMMTACSNGHLDVVQFLAEKDAKSIMEADKSGLRPMSFACQNGHFDVVTFLANKEAGTISQVDNDGWTTMMFACQSGNLDIVTFLAERDSKLVSQANKSGATPIMSASENGHLAVVKFLAELSPNLVSQADNNGWTPFMFACSNGHLEVIRFLAEKSPKSLSKSNKGGLTLTMFACAKGLLDMVKFLVERDPKLVSQSDNDGWTPIMYACQNGHLEVVKFLAEKDAKLVLKGNNGGVTPMMHACENGHLAVVKFLADCDMATLTQSKSNGWTPIMSACLHGHVEVVEFLAELDSNLALHAMNGGVTPMMVASEHGHLEVVKFLAQKDTDLVFHTDHVGWTPVELARGNLHFEVVEYLQRFQLCDE